VRNPTAPRPLAWSRAKRDLGRALLAAPLALAATLALEPRALPSPAAPAPPAIPAHLTLDDALRLFREKGLDLIISEAGVASAEGDVAAAGAVPNPTLGASFSHAFTYQPAGMCDGATCTANGVGLDLNDNNAIEDSLSGKRGLRQRVARAAYQAARQTRADAQRNLEFQVKQQYIQAVLARDQLDFAAEVQASTAKTLELTQLRYQKGAVSEADEAKAETAKLEADQAASAAGRALAVGKLGLAFLLGVRGAVPAFEVDADLPKYAVPSGLAGATAGALLTGALDARPDLKAQRLQRDRAEAGVALARRLRFPDMALDINYQQAGSGGIGTNAPLTPPTLTIGLSLPVPLFYQQQGEIKKAEADLKLQEAQAAKVEAQVTSDVAVAHANFAAAKEQVERMQTRLLERARRARDLVDFQYQKGAASLLELLDAQRTYVATNVEYLNDLGAYWVAVFQLEQAVGTPARR
jgi:cobalt-zinc-cadmium efflux system outer membrane protein